MGNLPRLELTEEKSTFKNNDYIIFRNHDKGKKEAKIHSKKQIHNKSNTKKTKTKKTKTKKTKTKKTKKNRNKGFFSIF
jgi:hypothetical protein